MNGLEEQADNAKARDIYCKPLSWLGTLRSSSATDAFDQPLCETFFTSTVGLEVPVLSSLSRHHNSPLAKCGCKKHALVRKKIHHSATIPLHTLAPPTLMWSRPLYQS
jgi:hypothetical protein